MIDTFKRLDLLFNTKVYLTYENSIYFRTV